MRDSCGRWINANAEAFTSGAAWRTLDWLDTMILDTSRRIPIKFRRLNVEEDFTAEEAALALPVTMLHARGRQRLT